MYLSVDVSGSQAGTCEATTRASPRFISEVYVYIYTRHLSKLHLFPEAD